MYGVFSQPAFPILPHYIFFLSVPIDSQPIRTITCGCKLNETLSMEHNTEVKRSRLIRIGEVIRLSGLSRSYIYQLCNDNQFPKRIQLVQGGKSVAWLESEVIDWIESRVLARDEVA